MSRDRAPLADILERIELAIEFAGDDKARFKSSRINQEAVIRQLEVIGEAATRISAPTRARSGGVPWRSMTGFKNVAVHQDDAIDLDSVWAIVTVDLPSLRSKIRPLLSDLPNA